MKHFRLCNSNKVETQISPSYAPVTSSRSNEDISFTRLDQHGIRPKPGDSRTTTQSQDLLHVKNELFFFVLDLSFDENCMDSSDIEVWRNTESLSYYKYGGTQSPSTFLVSLLQDQFSGNSGHTNNFSKLSNLNSSMDILTVLVSTYGEYPEGYDTSSPYNGNCFLCSLNVLHVLDIFFYILIKETANPAITTVDPTFVTKLGLLWHSTLTLSSITTSVFSSEFSNSATNKSSFLWCKIIHKFCRVISNLNTIISAPRMVQRISNDAKILLDTLQLVYQAGMAITFIKNCYGTNSSFYYAICFHHWEVCHQFMESLKTINYFLKSEKINNNVTTTKPAPMLSFAKNKLAACIGLTAPTTDQFIAEASRIAENKGFLTLESQEEEDFLQNRLGFHGKLKVETAAVIALDDNLINALEAGTLQKVDKGQEKVLSTSLSGKMLFLIDGISLSIEILNFSIFPEAPKIPRPINNQQLNWFGALSEILLMSIYRGRNQNYPSIQLSSIGSYLAQQLFHLVSQSVAEEKQKNRLFCSFIKGLSNFTDLVRRKIRSLQEKYFNPEIPTISPLQSTHLRKNSRSLPFNPSIKQLPRQDSDSVISVSINSPFVKTNDHIKPTLSSANKISLDLSKLYSKPGITELQNNEERKEKNNVNNSSEKIKTQTEPKCVEPGLITFEVGDLIDGLCPLPNGTKRWFPGKVVDCLGNNTYSVEYNDGELKIGQNFNELRKTKRRPPRQQKPSEKHINPSIQPLQTISSQAFSEKTKGESEENAEESFAEPSHPLQYAGGSEKSGPGECAFPLDQDQEILQVLSGSQDSSNINDLPLMTKVVLDGDDDDDSESAGSAEDLVFEIPSVFENHGSLPVRKQRTPRDIVPRMQFDDLDVSGSLPHTSSAASLSGALLSENRAILNTNRSHLHCPSYDQQISTYRSINTLENSHENHPSLFQIGDRVSERKASNKINLRLSARLNPPLHENGFNSRLDSSRLNSSRLGHHNGHNLSAMDQSVLTHQFSWVGDDEITKNVMSSRTDNMNGLAGLAMNYAAGRADLNLNLPVTSIDSGFARDDVLMADEKIMGYWISTYTVISAMLLKNCVDHNGQLKTEMCKNEGLNQSSVGEGDINVVFQVREFLELCCAESDLAGLLEITQRGFGDAEAGSRLCKLLNPGYFRNCLPTHMERNGKKIGQGGFGSVYWVKCPAECGSFTRYQQCLSCYYRMHQVELESRRDTSSGEVGTPQCCAEVEEAARFCIPCNCWDSVITSVGGKSGKSSKTISMNPSRSCSFAVKRVPRERSSHDDPVIIALFNEISCLEKLKNNFGVCGIEDYGVNGAEYWIVMELGWKDLKVFRLETGEKSGLPRENSSSMLWNSFEFSHSQTPRTPVSVKKLVPLKKSDLFLYLLLFRDIILILKSVHKQHIVHFDLKCENFVLRADPRVLTNVMVQMHGMKELSGVLFLADFGEAGVDLQEEKGLNSLRFKGRGTLTIQSPEMICVSAGLSVESNEHVVRTSKKENVKKTGKKEFESPDAKSDLWSLGCLLIEMLTGKMLFIDKSWPELYTKLCMVGDIEVDLDGLNEILKEIPLGLIEEVKSLIMGLLQQEAKNRTNLDDLFELVSNLLEAKFPEFLQNPTNQEKTQENLNSSQHSINNLGSQSLEKELVVSRRRLSSSSETSGGGNLNKDPGELFKRLGKEFRSVGLKYLEVQKEVFIHFDSSHLLEKYFHLSTSLKSGKKISNDDHKKEKYNWKNGNYGIIPHLANVYKNMENSNLTQLLTQEARFQIQNDFIQSWESVIWVRIISHPKSSGNNEKETGKYNISGRNTKKDKNFLQKIKDKLMLSVESGFNNHCKVFEIDLLDDELNHVIHQITHMCQQIRSICTHKKHKVIITFPQLTKQVSMKNKLLMKDFDPEIRKTGFNQEPYRVMSSFKTKTQVENKEKSEKIEKSAHSISSNISSVRPDMKSVDSIYVDRQALCVAVSISLLLNIHTRPEEKIVFQSNLSESPGQKEFLRLKNVGNREVVNESVNRLAQVWRGFPMLEEACNEVMVLYLFRRGLDVTLR